jgi:hypothetical protein
MPKVIESVVRSGIEGFVNPEDSKSQKDAYVGLASSIIAFLIALALLSLIGKLLWNGVVVKLISVARPADSILQILGLFVFTSLLLG